MLNKQNPRQSIVESLFDKRICIDLHHHLDDGVNRCKFFCQRGTQLLTAGDSACLTNSRLPKTDVLIAQQPRPSHQKMTSSALRPLFPFHPNFQGESVNEKLFGNNIILIEHVINCEINQLSVTFLMAKC